MKLTTLIKGMLLGSGLVLLAACNSLNKNDNAAHGDANSAGVAGQYNSHVETTGLGTRASFLEAKAKAGKINASTGRRYNTIYFPYDNASIAEKYMLLVRENAAYLKAHPNARLRLEGNTDPRGSREYNIGLGQRRGNSVEDALEMLGVDRKQMIVVSYGKEKLAVPGTTAADYALDRRVEMLYERG